MSKIINRFNKILLRILPIWNCFFKYVNIHNNYIIIGCIIVNFLWVNYLENFLSTTDEHDQMSFLVI